MSPHSTSVFTAKEPVTGGRRRLTFSYSALTAAEMLAWRWISSSGCEWSAGWTERDDWTRCSGLRAHTKGTWATCSFWRQVRWLRRRRPSIVAVPNRGYCGGTLRTHQRGRQIKHRQPRLWGRGDGQLSSNPTLGVS
jgi:hypothetical protein